MGKLTRQQDAYGQAMWDYLHHGRGFEIVERDDGLAAVSSGPPTYMAPFKDWPPHQKKAIRLARGRVLDIGCGAGRVALHLGGMLVTECLVLPDIGKDRAGRFRP